jgi:hypothetical protein
MRVADYIDRNILCQAYVHIQLPKGMDAAKLSDLKKHLELFIKTRGQFFLYEDVETDVEFKDGSLKVVASIAGALYVAIAQYGSFRDGVNFLTTDTKRLAECVVSESLFLTKSRHGETIRTEARIGVVGTLKVALDKLDHIKEEMGSASLQTTNRQIVDLQQQIETLIGNLNDPADPPFVSSELCKLVESVLPRTPIHDPKKPKPPEIQVAAYHRARSELIEHLKKTATAKRTR